MRLRAERRPALRGRPSSCAVTVCPGEPKTACQTDRPRTFEGVEATHFLPVAVPHGCNKDPAPYLFEGRLYIFAIHFLALEGCSEDRGPRESPNPPPESENPARIPEFQRASPPAPPEGPKGKLPALSSGKQRAAAAVPCAGILRAVGSSGAFLEHGNAPECAGDDQDNNTSANARAAPKASCCCEPRCAFWNFLGGPWAR